MKGAFLRTSFHALPPWGRALWKCGRWMITPHSRFFFEGSMKVPGQLWRAERELLYSTILRHQPTVVVEVGTWEGGGSTFFIAEALHRLGKGILHTFETDTTRHAKAVEGYRQNLPHLLPHVRFHHGSSVGLGGGVLESAGAIDALFLDGAQDAEQTLLEYELFQNYFTPSTVLMMHDWDNDKMRLLRDLLQRSDGWRVTAALTFPDSVGFAVCERSPDV